jgi:2-dehydro-3-deoxy-D-gluconate 5-dehydrogenase
MSVLDLFRLNGKTALVTGCSRGIGEAMAIALAEAGADVVGVSKSLPASGSPVEKAVTALGRTFHAFNCDLGDRDALYAFLGRVNNAGTIQQTPAAEHSDGFWDEVLGANLHAPWILSRELGRRMIDRGSGKIIFTASLLSFQGGITVPGYAASKGAVAQLVKALANEWAAKGVQVNAIAPGYITTDNTTALRSNPERNSAILARIPAGRWGEPSDLAGATVFLASAASNYVNGEILVVDGGWMGR